MTCAPLDKFLTFDSMQTGASMGIGEATALKLAENGVNVALVSRSKVSVSMPHVWSSADSQSAG